MEMVPVEAAFISTLSEQEVPDYFAGPAMVKTITQVVVFEEWKAAMLANWNPLKIGVYRSGEAGGYKKYGRELPDGPG